MCMNRVTERGLNVSGVGWKVFKEYEKNLVMGEYHDGVIEIGRWVSKATYPPDLSRMTLGGGYESGFHVFETWEGAEEWNKSFVPGKKILKVKYRCGHTRGCYTGWDHPMPCIVADEIMIVKEREK